MMDKLISQQAAIDAVEFGITYAKAINKDTGEVRELFKQSNEELRKAVERIKQLQSAEPESISKWKKEFREYVDSLDIARDDWKGIIEYIDELPSVQLERKTGRWVESNPQDSKLCRLMTCSECGKAYIVNINVPYEDWTEAHKFCVECGTKMEGGEQDG